MHAMSDVELIQHVLQNRNNYYRVLMVERTAGDKEVKAAYRKMALRCHPDKCTHAHAAEAFKLVGTAYATLSDSAKRQIYDRHGVDGVQRHESNMARRQTNGAAAAAGGMRRGPGARAGPQNAHEFFQEFFFGNAGGFFGEAHGGGARFVPHQQRAYAYAAPRGGGQGGQGGYEQADIPAAWLMLLPVVLFIVLAVLLQSSMTDVTGATWRSGASTGGAASSGYATGGGHNAAGAAMSTPMMSRDVALTPDPERGIVVQRQILLRGVQVPYYTTRMMHERMMRSVPTRHAVEKEVLRSQLSYLANSCEVETLRYRTKRRNEVPGVCSELQRFRKALG